jgi:hypothetical protein
MVFGLYSLILDQNSADDWTNWTKVKTRTIILLVGVAVSMIVVYTQLTVFVIQPIGAVPEGRTLIIPRSGKLNFIDSADGVCLCAGSERSEPDVPPRGARSSRQSL